MKGPNRQRKPGRREAFRDPRPIVLIVCEGEETEKQYFEQFARHNKTAMIKVEIAKETGVPLSLVRHAKEYKQEIERTAKLQKDQNIAYDSVWCVFDVDEHPGIPNARNMAASNNIHLAISNPCFELWLLLHLRESPGMRDRHGMQALLKSTGQSHDKNVKHVNFERFAPGYEEAVRRARRLDDQARDARTPGHNPTTNVYELTELIRKGRDEGRDEPSISE